MRGYEALVDRLRRSTVQVVTRGGGGSGVVWDADGTIVTNAHVARREEMQVIDADGRRLLARVTRRDVERDLALLETGASFAEPATIGDSSIVRAGQIALAIGNPLGITGALAAGMIHAVGPLEFGSRHNWIQADVRLAPGNSGGMLADAEGSVIGINTMVFHGLGLAIPSNEARAFAANGASRARLGVEMIRVREGLMVVAVERGSTAERARVLIGDVLLCTPEQLRARIEDAVIDGSTDIPILRSGRSRTLRVHFSRSAEAKAA